MARYRISSGRVVSALDESDLTVSIDVDCVSCVLESDLSPTIRAGTKERVESVGIDTICKRRQFSRFDAFCIGYFLHNASADIL